MLSPCAPATHSGSRGIGIGKNFFGSVGDGRATAATALAALAAGAVGVILCFEEGGGGLAGGAGLVITAPCLLPRSSTRKPCDADTLTRRWTLLTWPGEDCEFLFFTKSSEGSGGGAEAGDECGNNSIKSKIKEQAVEALSRKRFSS